jgi:hypothetical protein
MQHASAPITAVALTATEWQLVETALRAFLSDFGAGEAEIIEQIRAVLGKLPVLPMEVNQ